MKSEASRQDRMIVRRIQRYILKFYPETKQVSVNEILEKEQFCSQECSQECLLSALSNVEKHKLSIKDGIISITNP